MDLNKFTVKCQEALQAAQTKAINFNHQEVDGEHLLLVLLEQPDGLVPRLLQRMEVSVNAFRERLERELDKKGPHQWTGVRGRQGVHHPEIE